MTRGMPAPFSSCRILSISSPARLDTGAGLEILNVVQELNGAGIALVMVTHEREVADHGDRVILLRDGLITGTEEVSTKRFSSLPPAEVGSPQGDGAGDAL